MNKKTATALSLSAVLGVSAAVGGGTYALFSDNETATGQSISTGTIDLGAGDAATAEVGEISNLAPGSDIADQTVTFGNTSSLPGTVTLTFEVPDDRSACSSDSETDAEKARDEVDATDGTCSNDLDDQTQVVVTDGSTPVYSGSVAGLREHEYSAPLAAGDGLDLTFAYTFADAEDNNLAQGDAFSITTIADLTS